MVRGSLLVLGREPSLQRAYAFFFSRNGWQSLALTCKLSPPTQGVHLWKLIKLTRPAVLISLKKSGIDNEKRCG